MGGSVAITGAGNDVDVLVYVDGDLGYHSLLYGLKDLGYLSEGSGGEDSEWTSLKNGNVNVLLISDKDMYDGFELSTYLCQRLHAQFGICDLRETRVLIHQVVRDRIKGD